MARVTADALLAAIRDLADAHPGGWWVSGADGTLLLVSGSQLAA
jgi:hypothetical protein